MRRVLETKGFDPLRDIKAAAAARWVTAVNADGRYGVWAYELADRIPDIGAILDRVTRQAEDHVAGAFNPTSK